MAPAPAGRRMGACETPPPTHDPRGPLNTRLRPTAPPRPQHAPLLVGVQLVRPRPLRRLRALQLDPSSAPAPHATRRKQTITQPAKPSRSNPWGSPLTSG